MYGKSRTKHLTRLHDEAAKGATQIRVEPNLDLVPGDRLALAATSFDFQASDEVFVDTYDSVEGIVTLTAPLDHYHFGAPLSTASDYNGQDLRGEVLILSRNIVIAGQDVETWGAQIVTSDTIEGDLTMRVGQTVLHNVEIYNCSQINTFKSALRFEGASGSFSHIKGVSLHNGHSWAINIQSSANVRVEDTVVFSFKPIGISILSSMNVTIENNVVAHIYERPKFEGQH
jgi:hypothetical protein